MPKTQVAFYREDDGSILYFFHGQKAAVLSHGMVKERAVPPREIELAMRRKRKFEEAPKNHTHSEG